MAVNIGYSIGFGYPAEKYDPYLWFSTVYVLVRAQSGNMFSSYLNQREFMPNPVL